jgi:hypothetical protein
VADEAVNLKEKVVKLKKLKKESVGGEGRSVRWKRTEGIKGEELSPTSIKSSPAAFGGTH